MNTNLKFVVAAVALACVGSASAAIEQPNAQGGSSLLLSVWDAVKGVSYTRDLGVQLSNFLPNSVTTALNDGITLGVASVGNKTPAAGLTLPFATDSLFTSTFSASSLGDISWSVNAFDNQSTNANNLARFASTVNGPAFVTNASMAVALSQAVPYYTAVAPGLTSATSTSTNDASSAAFAGGNFLTGQETAVGNISTTIGSPLDFYYFTRTVASGSGSQTANTTQYGNDANFAKFTLATDGTLTYALAPAQVSEVPVPAAAWLLGSGLVGMFGAARRRKAAAGA